jgi:hypothetical protein
MFKKKMTRMFMKNDQDINKNMTRMLKKYQDVKKTTMFKINYQDVQAPA